MIWLSGTEGWSRTTLARGELQQDCGLEEQNTVARGGDNTSVSDCMHVVAITWSRGCKVIVGEGLRRLAKWTEQSRCTECCGR